MGAACSCGGDSSKVYHPAAAPIHPEGRKIHPAPHLSFQVRPQAAESQKRTTPFCDRAVFASASHPTGGNVTVQININDNTYEVPAGSTIRAACEDLGIRIPTLCYHPRLKPPGRCRTCTVEVLGGSESRSVFKLACSTKVTAGMTIHTDTPEVRAERQTAVRAMMVKMKLANRDLGASLCTEFGNLVNSIRGAYIDDSSPSIVRDMSLCVDCGRCVSACRDIQDIQVLAHATDPDAPAYIDTQAGLPLEQTDCVRCGQCSVFCPTGAITERDETAAALSVLKSADDKRIKVVQFAPSTRVAISEAFGLEPGTVSTGKMIAALRALGFQHVFDTNFAADLTIMEEGHELLDRLKNDGTLPLFTSCCPAWVTLVEKLYPEMVPHVSTCKSPQQMMGAVIKSFFAEKHSVKPADIFSVSIMPCTAKKYERTKPDNMGRDDESPDVDLVLTTRELARMIKAEGIDFNALEESTPDSALGASTGAGAIFGVTGGVMEAALRTVYEVVTGKTLEKLEFDAVRGLSGLKTTTVALPGQTVRIGVAHGLANARETLAALKAGTLQLDMLEVMACPGGCIGGGGQPRSSRADIIQLRMDGIYSIDESSTIRKSHENPEVQALYSEFLGDPNGVRAHELLHTSYRDYSTEMARLVRKRPKKVVKVAYDMGAGPMMGAEGGSTGGVGQTPGESVCVLYGTNTGSAEDAARQILAKTKQKGYRARMSRMSQYNLEQFTDEVMIIFVVSTCGDGDITDDAVAMYDYLCQKHPPKFLRNLKFAVFGLGSRDYEHFSMAGKLFEKRLLELGAKETHPRGDGDEAAPEHHNEALDPWMETAVASIPKELLESAPRLPYQIQLHAMRAPDEVIPEGCHRLIVLKNTSLSVADAMVEVRYIELAAGKDDELPLHPADLISISPRNLPDATREFISHYGLNPDDVISVKPNAFSVPLPLPPQLTIQQLFESYLDIFGRPTRSFFEKLAGFATNERERRVIERLANVKSNAQQFKSYYESGSTYADSLREFPSARPPLGALVDMVRLIKLRRYTLANAPVDDGGRRIELLVIIDHFETPRGWKTGLCSTFLEECLPGDHVAVSAQATRVKPPADVKAPIVMVGVGSGIASFRSILQDRQNSIENGAKLGPSLLFFGFSSESRDFFFAADFEQFQQSGALSHFVPVAQEDEERSVTDAMTDNLSLMYDLLSQKHSAFLLVGPSTIVPSVIQNVIESAFVQYGGMDERKAKQYVRTMKKERRYTVEFHGSLGVGDSSTEDSGSVRSGSTLGSRTNSQVY